MTSLPGRFRLSAQILHSRNSAARMRLRLRRHSGSSPLGNTNLRGWPSDKAADFHSVIDRFDSGTPLQYDCR
jgi:hypothetical protein